MWNTYGNQNNVKKKSVYFITILIYCQIALTSPNIYSLLLFSIQNIIELFWLFEMQFISDFYSLAVELIVMHFSFSYFKSHDINFNCIENCFAAATNENIPGSPDQIYFKIYAKTFEGKNWKYRIRSDGFFFPENTCS